MAPRHVPPVAGGLHRLGHLEVFVPCLGGCCAAAQVLQLRFQKRSSCLAESRGGAGSGAHQELLKTWGSVALSRAVPEHLTKRGPWLVGSAVPLLLKEVGKGAPKQPLERVSRLKVW